MTSPTPNDQSTYFRKGFGLKADVQEELAADYDGRIVDLLRSQAYTLLVGMSRSGWRESSASATASSGRWTTPTRPAASSRTGGSFSSARSSTIRIVNDRLREMGIEILDASGARPARSTSAAITPEDVVIMPAFGVTIDDFAALRAIGCVLVDTTCGSVLNVWKRVESYARDGFTALIHGKYYHEETRATASQVRKYPDGHYLIVRNMDEARSSASSSRVAFRRDALMSTFAHAVSPGFDPERHLKRIGVANQTTMLARESLAIAEEVGARSRARVARRLAPRTSAASTRSAARRRSDRTPCVSCSRTAST